MEQVRQGRKGQVYKAHVRPFTGSFRCQRRAHSLVDGSRYIPMYVDLELVPFKKNSRGYYPCHNPELVEIQLQSIATERMQGIRNLNESGY